MSNLNELAQNAVVAAAAASEAAKAVLQQQKSEQQKTAHNDAKTYAMQQPVYCGVNDAIGAHHALNRTNWKEPRHVFEIGEDGVLYVTENSPRVPIVYTGRELAAGESVCLNKMADNVRSITATCPFTFLMRCMDLECCMRSVKLGTFNHRVDMFNGCLPRLLMQHVEFSVRLAAPRGFATLVLDCDIAPDQERDALLGTSVILQADRPCVKTGGEVRLSDRLYVMHGEIVRKRNWKCN